ncbi:MAG: hypothetical protein AAF572_08275 [Cyanobacteria bacterium P01_B01_bin.77]
MKSLMYGLMGAAIAPALVMAPASAATLESSLRQGETVVNNVSVELVKPTPAHAAYALMGIAAAIALVVGSRKHPEYELEPIRVKFK